MKDTVKRFFRDFAHRCIKGEFMTIGDLLQVLEKYRVSDLSKWYNTNLSDTAPIIRNHQFEINLMDLPEALAFRALTIWGIKRK